MDENKEYDVALSFAGEQRAYVEGVDRELKNKGNYSAMFIEGMKGWSRKAL